MLKRVVGNSLFYLLGMLLSTSLGFLLLPLYTRYLSPADYGVLAVSNTTSTLLGGVISLSIESAIIFFYFKLEKDEFQKLLRTIWLWMILVPLVMVSALDTLGSNLSSGFLPNVPWNPYIRLAIWVAYFSVAPLIPLALLRMEQRAHVYAAFTITSFLLAAALMIYFIVFRGEGAVGSLRGQLYAGIITAVISHTFVLSRLRSWRWPWIDGKYLATALRLCLPYLPHVFCMWLLNLSDRWILGHYVPLSTLGVYNLAYMLGMMQHFFGMSVLMAFEPLYRQNASVEEFRARLPKILAGLFMAYTWVALAIALLAPEILRVMTTPAFYGAAPLVPWIVMAYWCYMSIYGLSMTVMTHHQRTGWTILLTGPAALLNISLNWLLIPRYGVMAAAANTLLAFVLMAATSLWVSRKMDKLPYPWGLIAAMLVLAAGAYWLGSTWLTLSNLGGAIAAKGLLLLTAGLIMARLSGLDLRELMTLRKQAQGAKTIAT